ncbi:MAG TPA: cellulase family glycosylhydrolase [Anaerolineaceae bacterium]|nr:cellulase family glycosylhydrolase [Anaerolineaceae bacterium]HPN53618.1 cellulase family glycosylhydrolase [Anaerolineaceae bacterium]
MTLPAVTLSGNYFSTHNRRFIPIGAHWVPARTGLQYPLRWDEVDIEADFAKMKDLGFNTMRFDLFWAWFEPHPGVYNPEAFQQFDFFIRMAHKYDIYIHPALFIGGEVGEAFWDVPWRQGRHPHADAEMLRLQTDHAAEFARRYQGETAILAWDLTDEPPFWIVAGETTDAMAINWTRLISGAIRRYDPEHILCVGTSVEDIGHGTFRPDNLAGEVDFFSVHPYSIYTLDRFPDPMLSERGTYAGAFQTLLSAGAGKPTMIHEFGASSAQYSPERVAHFDRVTLYSGLAAGACGFLPWCYTDAAPKLFRQFPYRRAPHETQFGLTTWDRQDRPRGKVLRDFSKVLAQMDLNGIEPAPAEAALIIPHEWAKPLGDLSRSGLTAAHTIPYTPVQDAFPTGEENVWLTRALLNTFILGRRAGLKVDMPREYSVWQNRPMLLLPSPLTSTERNLVHIHTIFWDEVRDYVSKGGILYASLCADAAIPEMADLFGASLADHCAAGEVTLTFVQPFGDIAAGSTFHYHADPANPRSWPATLDMAGGTVLAVDQDGRPAIVSHTYGKGKTLLSAYPLEVYVGSTPDAFEHLETTHFILQALAKWAGLKSLFSTDVPGVEVGALCGVGRGYAVLANHQPQARSIRLTSREALREAALLDANGRHPLAVHNQGCSMELPAYGGAVIEWRL